MDCCGDEEVKVMVVEEEADTTDCPFAPAWRALSPDDERPL
jgi:hypothetical protein